MAHLTCSCRCTTALGIHPTSAITPRIPGYTAVQFFPLLGYHYHLFCAMECPISTNGLPVPHFDVLFQEIGIFQSRLTFCLRFPHIWNPRSIAVYIFLVQYKQGIHHSSTSRTRPCKTKMALGGAASWRRYLIGIDSRLHSQVKNTKCMPITLPHSISSYEFGTTHESAHHGRKRANLNLFRVQVLTVLFVFDFEISYCVPCCHDSSVYS